MCDYMGFSIEKNDNVRRFNAEVVGEMSNEELTSKVTIQESLELSGLLGADVILFTDEGDILGIATPRGYRSR